MIDFSGGTYRNLLNGMLAEVPDLYDKRDGSMIQTALGPAAYALEGFYLDLDRVQQAAYLQTAAGQALDYLGTIAGLARYQASPAVRLGVFNAAVPVGARFSTINGADSINFTVTSDADNQYQLTAETPGDAGNSYAGPILPITFIEGLTSAAVTDILVPGDEEETDDAFRARIITALNERPFGGNIAAYRENILEIDGVGAVQVYPTWNGGGTVKCSVLGSDFLPASATLLENVQNAVDPPPNQGLGLGTAPIGAQVTVTAPDKVTVDVTAAVSLAPGSSIEQVQPLAEAATEAYLLGVRQSWGEPVGQTAVEYAANVYLSRILAAIVGTAGIVNVTEVKLNGAAEDLILTETGTIQQVPVLGMVTLHE